MVQGIKPMVGRKVSIVSLEYRVEVVYVNDLKPLLKEALRKVQFEESYSNSDECSLGMILSSLFRKIHDLSQRRPRVPKSLGAHSRARCEEQRRKQRTMPIKRQFR